MILFVLNSVKLEIELPGVDPFRLTSVRISQANSNLDDLEVLHIPLNQVVVIQVLRCVLIRVNRARKFQIDARNFEMWNLAHKLFHLFEKVVLPDILDA